MCDPALVAPAEVVVAAVPLAVALEAVEVVLALEAADAVPDVAATDEVPAIKLVKPPKDFTGNNGGTNTARGGDGTADDVCYNQLN